MNIVTLTLNPAYDIHCYVENFEPQRENFASITSRDAGGKGVNISRALSYNGVENLALVVLGEENADDFVKSLKEDSLTFCPITLKGRIRENITVHTKGSAETRISFAGFEADDSLLEQVAQTVCDKTDADSIVTVTGSLPLGLSMASVKKLLAEWKQKGVRIVIDSRSFSLHDLVEIKPWLIKPNQEEISAYLGREIGSFDEVIESARELHGKGIENVMISLGAKGGLLVNGEGAFVAKPPACKPVSTIGAGDSSIAGFVAAAKEKKGGADCLKNAMAYGNAACFTEGTRPPEPQKVKEVLEQIEFEIKG